MPPRKDAMGNAENTLEAIAKPYGIICFASGSKMLTVGERRDGSLTFQTQNATNPPENRAISIYKFPESTVDAIAVGPGSISTSEAIDLLGQTHTRFDLHLGPTRTIQMLAPTMAKDILVKDTVVGFTGGAEPVSAISLTNPDNPQEQILMLMLDNQLKSPALLGAAFRVIADGLREEYSTSSEVEGKRIFDSTFFNQVAAAFKINIENNRLPKFLSEASNLIPIYESLLYALAVKAQQEGQEVFSDLDIASKTNYISPAPVAQKILESALADEPTVVIDLTMTKDKLATATTLLHLLIPNLHEPNRRLNVKQTVVSTVFAKALLEHVGVSATIRRDEVTVSQPREPNGRFAPKQPEKPAANLDTDKDATKARIDSWKNYQPAANSIVHDPYLMKYTFDRGFSNLDVDSAGATIQRLDLMWLLNNALSKKQDEQHSQDIQKRLDHLILIHNSHRPKEAGNESVKSSNPNTYSLVDAKGKITSGWTETSYGDGAVSVFNNKISKEVLLLSFQEATDMKKRMSTLNKSF